MENKKVRENLDSMLKIEISDQAIFNENTVNIGGFHKRELTFLKKNTHTPIDVILDFILVSKLAGATHIDFYANCTSTYDSPECESIDISSFKERDETEEEFSLRIKKEESIKLAERKDKEAREQEQYLKLKAKFEGK